MKPKKPPPFEFVLDRLGDAPPFVLSTRPMFGCTAVYADERIVLALREKETETHDNGIWLATTREHHRSLKREFPSMRSIRVLGGDGPTGWQNLPADADDFENAAERACRLILRGDPRIGKIPARKKTSQKKFKKTLNKRHLALALTGRGKHGDP